MRSEVRCDVQLHFVQCLNKLQDCSFLFCCRLFFAESNCESFSRKGYSIALVKLDFILVLCTFEQAMVISN
uniref:Uncharacterized protein n=1 Tax=Rhizophora mucronata TaxID=61149 RepID=A0A2P2N075_RHIMU